MVTFCIVIGFSVPVLGATSNVIFENKAEKFVFLPGSEYTDTDLFDNFKNMMPGDSRTQTVVVKNDYKGFDSINVYMRAVLHGDENPLSESVAASETVDSMHDFLKQFSMIVRLNGRVIYSASPDELDGLASNVFLGNIAYGETVKLDVELSLPETVGNEYANRVGEVDWVFTVEEVEKETPDTPDIPVNPPIIPSFSRATITAVKTLDGKTPDTNEFQFQLTDATGKVLQTANNKGADVIFNTLTYLTPGVYTYYIKEIPGTNADIEYDSTVYTVKVTVNSVLGYLTTSVAYEKNGVAYVGVPVFRNTTIEDEPVIPDEPIEPEPTVIEPAYVDIFAGKTLNKHVATGSDFTFLLSDSDGNVIQTTNNEDGYIFFERLKFDSEGVYTYYMTEQKGTDEDMVYDGARYKITVTVTENGEKYEATVTYERNGLEYDDMPIFENRTAEDSEIPETSDSGMFIYIAIACVCLASVMIIVIKSKKHNH